MPQGRPTVIRARDADSRNWYWVQGVEYDRIAWTTDPKLAEVFPSLAAAERFEEKHDLLEPQFHDVDDGSEP